MRGTSTLPGVPTTSNLVTLGGFQGTYGGGSSDAYVAKLSSDGSALLYLSYLGGGDVDYAEALVVDDVGNVYVGGRTDGAFLTTVGAYDESANGGMDGFVTKVDTTQTGAASLVYSTHIGGSSSDFVHGLDVDAGRQLSTSRDSRRLWASRRHPTPTTARSPVSTTASSPPWMRRAPTSPTPPTSAAAARTAPIDVALERRHRCGVRGRAGGVPGRAHVSDAHQSRTGRRRQGRLRRQVHLQPGADSDRQHVRRRRGRGPRRQRHRRRHRAPARTAIRKATR